MMTCREVARAIATEELDTAPWRRRLAVRPHLVTCSNCRRYARQIRRIGAGARALFAETNEDREQVARVGEAILERCSSDV